jgi:hypothetical protein
MGLRASKRTSTAERMPSPSKSTSKPASNSQTSASASAASATKAAHSANSAGASDQPGLVDATVYDFERLERAIAALADEHERTKLENLALRRATTLREARIAELEGKLRMADERRLSVLDQIDAMMTGLDALPVHEAAAASSGDADQG